MKKFQKISCNWWWLYWFRNGFSLVKTWSEVTVIEYLDYITPGMDREISNEFQKILTKQGIKFKMGSKVNQLKERKLVSIKYTI